MKKFLIFCLAIFAGLFVKSEICFAGGYTVETESTIYETTVYNTAKFERTDGGWQITSGGTAFIRDAWVNPSYSYAACSGTAQFLYQLPAAVVTHLKAGDNVLVYAEAPGSATNVSLSTFSYTFNGNTSLTYNLMLSPVIAKKTLNDFVSGLSCKIPIIPDGYGYNLYSVYPTIGSEVLVLGYYSNSNTSEVKSGYIHPSIIKNSKGAFKSGNKISINGTLKATTFFTIGKSGSFASGTAVKLVFNCPVKLVFTVKSSYYVSVPDDPVSPPVVPDPEPEDSEEPAEEEPEESEEDDEDDEEADDPVKTKFSLRIHRTI